MPTIPHPLVCHLIDTAVVAEVLYPIVVGPQCRAELDAAFQPVGDPRIWAAFFCGLHDIGKLSPAFQSLRVDIAARDLPKTAAERVARVDADKAPGHRTDTPHGELTAIHLHRMLTAWGADRPIASTISDAVGGHHGIFASAAVLDQARTKIRHHGGSHWAAWADGMANVVAAALGLPAPDGLPWAQVRLAPAGAVALAGLTVISDWLASGMVAQHDFAGIDVDLAAYLDLTRSRAAALIAGLRWEGWSPPPETSFQGLFDHVGARPVQLLVEQIADTVTGPAIMVIEAPTGEGKTKAALQYTATVVRRLGLAGFFLAMPTRATSNQAFVEVRDMLDPQVGVKLLHGTAVEFLSTQRRRSRDPRVDEMAPTELGIDGPSGNQDDRVRDWFTHRRGLVAPVAVGTVDRLEQAAIRSWFVTLPLVGLSNRVVIVDEIHAYDLYMSTVLDRALWWLGRLGVPVVLLSATLAVARRDELIRQWQAGALRCRPDEVPTRHVRALNGAAASYPRVTWADASGTTTMPCDASPLNRNRTVGLRHLDDADLIEVVLGWATAGQSVAVIRDTRRRARAARAAFERAIAGLPVAERPELLFLTSDVTNRLEVEQRLYALFGKGAPRPNGAVVVGTSVLGLSLDLDFDAIVSDLAPIDSLIQRAGRLHRFRLIVQPPVLAITGVTDTQTDPIIGPGIRRVYQDWILLRTWALLRDRTQLRLPAEVPELVDAVYGEPDAVDCPPKWATRLRKAAASQARTEAVDAMKARTIYLKPPPRQDTAAGFLRELTFHPKSATRTRKSPGWAGESER